ncbi:hypothetical protein SRABI04_01271 [Chryseobacterium sp. Bi04]|nr:hypothetical protein SRABI04_01271 [Chryseobacterium sp. Bi04]
MEINLHFVSVIGFSISVYKDGLNENRDRYL